MCCFHVVSFQWPALVYKFFVSIGKYSGLCTGILDSFLVCSYLMSRVCSMHEWLHWTGANGVMPTRVLCNDVYSAAICRRGVELC
jgi:hypothetical protein